MCIQTYHSGHHNGLEYYYIGKNNKLKLVDREKIGFRRTLGFELECDGFPSYDVAVAASDIVDDVYGNYAHCERDSSLGVNSLELISQPMTLAAHRRGADWKPLLDKLEELGGKSHDTATCGLHVHVSRKAFGTTSDNQALAIGKLLELVERFELPLVKLARRDWRNSYWASYTGYGHSTSDSSRKIRGKARSEWLVTSRYKAINLTNAATVEFRFFKGTLKYETLMATLALCDGMVAYVTTHTTPDVHAVTIQQLIDYINDDGLTKYATARGVY